MALPDHPPPLTVQEIEVEVAGRAVRLLRPADPDALLEAAAAAGTPAPYWAEPWPSAWALAEAIGALDLRGRSVLELGAGLGLPSIVAAQRGADVLATDVDPAPLALVERSAARNDVTVRTAVLDWDDPPTWAAAGFDAVVAADVLYEPASARALAALLPIVLRPGAWAIVAMPWPHQADGLVERLGDGWSTATRRTTAPGWHGRASSIWLTTFRRAPGGAVSSGRRRVPAVDAGRTGESPTAAAWT